ncbi:MAG: hypothetical protein RL091_2046 [Verrucomicrobiota bacterium]|jgi:hypothetical protein
MHTIIVTAIGFILLGIMVALARSRDRGAARFIPVWFVLCLIHLAFGVLTAGYGLVEELGVHAIVFGAPAALAFALSRVLRPKT